MLTRSRLLTGTFRSSILIFTVSGLAGLAVAGTGPAPGGEADRVEISPEPRQWHRVTLSLRGPATDEKARPNPFSDFRLTATFTHESGKSTLVVPGHFAADGRAAETSATSGDVWRVHVAPDRVGRWSYRLSMVRGKDVAVSGGPGEPVAEVDGLEGSFVVAPGDRELPDLRARGALRYVGERYLRFAGDGTWFLKGGVGSPETLLGYADFDGTFRDLTIDRRPPAPHLPIRLPALDAGEGLHRFEPHVKDWREGDPTWKDGRGKGIIGGINYLADRGVNTIYFLTMNVNGDGRSTWPWTSPDERDRYDCSKLDQWEIVFEHMTRKGLQLHVVTQETENDHLLDGGEAGRERRLYYRELVSRFAHHPAITWNLGEENVQSPRQQIDCLRALAEIDPYDHLRVIHNDHWHAKNLRETFDPLLDARADGEGPLLTGTAIQDFYWPDIHSHVLHYVRVGMDSKSPRVICADELGGANLGTVPDREDPEHDAPRRQGLWGTLMAGGAGVEWYFGWQNNSPDSDLSAEDWRTREAMYRQTKIALDFFHEHLPFHRMVPAPGRVVGHGVMALELEDDLLVIYLPDGAGTRFSLGGAPGPHEMLWFDPRNGGKLQEGSLRLARGPGLAWTGDPPRDRLEDWVVVVRRIPETAPAMTFPGESWTHGDPLELGIHPSGLKHALNRWRMDIGENGVDQVVIARRGIVIHEGKIVERVHNLWSATKSFTSTLLGLLIEDGRVSLDTPAARIDPGLATLYPDVQMRHFASMTSGYSAAGKSRWNSTSEDWSRTPYRPEAPLFAPGELFAYWDEAQMMFGRLLTRVARRDLLEFARERLLEPIGIEAEKWGAEGEIDGIPVRNGCTGLFLDARDLARFGHLFLNEGRWKDRQVVPARWVRLATTPRVPTSVPVADTDRKSLDGSGVYGYNWWVNGVRPDGRQWMPNAPADAYFAAGLNHNICLVIPSWEMVIVRMGTDGNPALGHAGALDRFLRRLGMAVAPLVPASEER